MATTRVSLWAIFGFCAISDPVVAYSNAGCLYCQNHHEQINFLVFILSFQKLVAISCSFVLVSKRNGMFKFWIEHGNCIFLCNVT